MASRTGDVRVCLRVRPRTKEERRREPQSCLHVDTFKGAATVHSAGTNKQTFAFDRVYDDRSSQNMVYKEMVLTLVQDFVAGRNCCVLAYGPHGTGKTHTLIGAGLPNESDDNDDANNGPLDDEPSTVSSLGSCGVSKLHVSNSGMESVSAPMKPPNQVVANIHGGGAGVHKRKELSSVTGSFMEETATSSENRNSTASMTDLDIDAGSILRAGQSIFEMLRKWTKRSSSTHVSGGSSSSDKNGPPIVRCSYVELFMDRTIDLLHQETARGTNISYVTLQQQPNGSYVENATEVLCKTLADVFTALIRGRRSRRATAQRLKIEEGQSHVVFIFKVERFSRSKGKRTTSRLFLVDLASSELVRKPGAGADKQTVHIFKSVKKSLGALRKCLHAMAAAAPHQEHRAPSPYDDSNLTKMLHDALVPGSGGVSLFVTVDKSLANVTETLSAIRFGIYAAGQSSAGGETEPQGENREGDVTSSRKEELPPSDVSQPSTTLPSLPSTATTAPTAQTSPSVLTVPVVEHTPLGTVVYEGLKGQPLPSQQSARLDNAIMGSSRLTSNGSVSVRTWRGPKAVGKPEERQSASEEIAELRREIEVLKAENKRLVFSNQHLNQELTKYRKEGRAPFSSSFTADTEETGSDISNLNHPGARDDGDWDASLEDLTKETPIKVFLRLRPMTKLETSRRSRSCIEIHQGNKDFTLDSPQDGEYDFQFDYCFDDAADQASVYDKVGLPMVDVVLSGVNCSLIAFGLTGIGKEYVLLGGVPRIPVKKSDDDSTHRSNELDEQDKGIAPRIIHDLFAGMRAFPDMIEFKVTCSFVGIYLEKIYDLLEPCVEKTIFVRETVTGVELEGASEAFCFDEDDFIMVLHRGSAANSLLAARMRTDPSKSHIICMLNIEQRNVLTGATKKSYLQFVMVGGFEISTKAKTQSVQESKFMQKSFTAFDHVVKAVSEGEVNAPFRDSKLTSVLKDAIGGNCRTAVIITASPSSYSISDTVNAIVQGKRMRRIINYPRTNRDASIDDYRKWLLENESKLNELTGLIRWYSALVEERKDGGHKPSSLTSDVWQSIEAIVSSEEDHGTPLREALVFGDNDGKLKGNAKYQALALELSKKFQIESIAEATAARHRAESLLSDLQSEVIVLRRQNELLSQEQQKKDSEVASSHQENRLIVLRNTDLEHQLNMAKSRAAEAVVFLCYLRALCWWLKKDIEKDRPVELREILYEISGTPDLTGLVDLDFILIDANIIQNSDVGVENIEERFAEYLVKAGLVNEEQKVFYGTDPDEISDVTGETMTRSSFTRRGDDKNQRQAEGESLLLRMGAPWFRRQASTEVERDPFQTGAIVNQFPPLRPSKSEWQLKRDLDHLADSCVELKLKLSQYKALVENLTTQDGDQDKRKLSQTIVRLSNERDRMIHHAKTAVWKLQELHVVNKLLCRKSAETQRKVDIMEEGFQSLQETFRISTAESLTQERELRDRLKIAEAIVELFTGRSLDGTDLTGIERVAREGIHLPIRGHKHTMNGGRKLIDPTSKESVPRCLMLFYKGKRVAKRSESTIHHMAKFTRQSKSTGTAILGMYREQLTKLVNAGRKLQPPRFKGKLSFK